MSITNVQVITAALTELRLVPEGESATGQQGLDGLRALNQMMAAWANLDMDLQFPPQDTLSDVCPIPIWAEEGVISNLAVKLAPLMQAPISPELAVKASTTHNDLAVILMRQNMREADTDHMPRGTGYRGNILTDGN